MYIDKHATLDTCRFQHDAKINSAKPCNAMQLHHVGVHLVVQGVLVATYTSPIYRSVCDQDQNGIK